MTALRKREQQWYGWRRSLPDYRDRKFTIPRRFQLESALPPVGGPEQFIPPVMDQGPAGSCVAHGVEGVMRTDRMSQGLPDLLLSRLQLYFDGREAEGTVNEDCGLEIRTAIKCVAKIGTAPERLWPYDLSRLKVKPPPEVYTAAKANEALEYERVDLTVHSIKAALASGHAVVFGISVYSSFESEAGEHGIINLPQEGESQIGGHCMYLYKYDDNADPTRVRGRNSYGIDWGLRGDFTIPWKYLCNTMLADDFWITKTVGPAPNPS